MARRRKLEEIQKKLGVRYPYFLCGLLNRYGLKGAAKELGVHWRTLQLEIMRAGIVRRWVVMDEILEELERLMEGGEGSGGED